MAECLFVGGMWQFVENTPAGVFVTGRACPPPSRSTVAFNPNVARIDLCPAEFGGDGFMRLDDPRCVRPSSAVSAARLLAGAAGYAGGTNGSGTNGGSSFFGGSGSGGYETEEVIVNGESGNGSISFRANVHGCGCDTPGDLTPDAQRSQWLLWLTLAIAIYAALREKK